jgi:P2-related tail formation protein
VFEPTTIVGKLLVERWAPWLTEDLAFVAESIGTPTQPLMEVLEEEGYPDQAGYVPAYGKIFNPETCPADFLPYLGMYVGVPIPLGTPEAEARALIKAESGQERGTEAAVKSAIERSISRFWEPDTEFLKGQLVRREATPGSLLCYEVTATFTSGATFETTHLTLVNIATQYELLPRERADGESNPYYFTVLCHPQQLIPEGNTTQLDANVKGTKPAGLVPEYVVTEEPLQADPVIDEGTLTIESVGEAVIETATLAAIT